MHQMSSQDQQQQQQQQQQHKELKMSLSNKMKLNLNHKTIISVGLILLIGQSVTCKSLQDDYSQSKWTPIKPDFKTTGEVQSESSTLDGLRAAGSSLEPVKEQGAARWQMQADPLSRVVSQISSESRQFEKSAPPANGKKESTAADKQNTASSSSQTQPRSESPEPSASVMRPSMDMSGHNSQYPQMNRPPVDQAEGADEGEDYNEESNASQDDRYKGPIQLDSAGSHEGPMSYRQGGSGSQLSNQMQGRPGATDGPNSAVDSEEEAMTAEQKEQEAAEASEAEAANQAALDEQQQQQRQIIMAQAQSEAKAIKEQQEALLRQQALQQQMLFKRYNDLNGNQTESNPVVDRGQMPEGRAGRKSNRRNNNNNNNKRFNEENEEPLKQHHNRDSAGDDYQDRPTYRGQHFKSSARQQTSSSDIQFSDQPDGRALNAALDNNVHDEVGDYSVRQPAITAPLEAQRQQKQQQQQQQQQQDQLEELALNDATLDQTRMNPVKDLLPAAQHTYGSHYKSLKSHQKDYYQFAESHKKGQFNSGFKRGGKKFQISGHTKQHKNDAEGHVKWSAKKGKGVQYWHYKHKGKKHHHHH